MMPDYDLPIVLAYGMTAPSPTTRMSGSATSTTRSEPGTLSTFASLSFAGDNLNPADITKLLGHEPTTAYRKGEIYKRSRGHEVVGRTGLWLLSSRGDVKSGELSDHLAYLKAVIFPPDGNDLVTPIRTLMRDERLEADVS